MRQFCFQQSAQGFNVGRFRLARCGFLRKNLVFKKSLVIWGGWSLGAELVADGYARCFACVFHAEENLCRHAIAGLAAIPTAKDFQAGQPILPAAGASRAKAYRYGKPIVRGRWAKGRKGLGADKVCLLTCCSMLTCEEHSGSKLFEVV